MSTGETVALIGLAVVIVAVFALSDAGYIFEDFMPWLRKHR